MASNVGIVTLPILHDARANTIWAKHRIDQLDAFFADYVKNNVSVTVKMLNADKPDFSQVFVAEAKLFPFPLGIVTGEIVRSLRASLDYAMAAMSAEQGASESDIENVYFPISRKDQGLDKLVDNRSIKFGLSRLRSFLIDEVKATPTGNFPLWALNEIDRQNKHRSIPVTIAVVLAPLPEWSDARDNWTSLEPGCKMEVPIPRHLHFEDQKQLDRTLDVRFGNTKVFSRQPLVPALAQLFNATVQTLGKVEEAYINAYHS